MSIQQIVYNSTPLVRPYGAQYYYVTHEAGPTQNKPSGVQFTCNVYTNGTFITSGNYGGGGGTGSLNGPFGTYRWIKDSMASHASEWQVRYLATNIAPYHNDAGSASFTGNMTDWVTVDTLRTVTGQANATGGNSGSGVEPGFASISWNYQLQFRKIGTGKIYTLAFGEVSLEAQAS